MNNNINTSEMTEGMFDRIKSKFSGYKQGMKNILGGDTTEMDSAKFNSLFKNFLNKAIATLSDFKKVISPYIKNKKHTTAELQQIKALLKLLEDSEKIKEVPIKEATLWTRPFSAIGAQMSGNVQSIINVYKKALNDYYNAFLYDAEKLNLVPSEYLNRKLRATFPASVRFLNNFLSTVNSKYSNNPFGMPLGTHSSSSPTGVVAASPPAVPPQLQPPQLQTPQLQTPQLQTPQLQTPQLQTPAVAASPTEVPPKLQPSKLKTPEPPIIGDSLELKDNNPETLGWQLVSKLLHHLDDKKIMKLIHTYHRRDANKATFVFPASPVAEITTPEGTTVKGHIRYLYLKDTAGYAFQVHLEKIMPSKGKNSPTSIRANKWENFIDFLPSELVKLGGKIENPFDLIKSIYKNNPVVASKMKEGKSQGEISTITQKIIPHLKEIIVASQPDEQRGVRALGIKKSKEKSHKDVINRPPTLSVGDPDTIKTSSKVSPEKQGRTHSVKPEIPPNLRGGETLYDKMEREKREKRASEPGKSETPPETKPKKTKSTGAKKKVSKKITEALDNTFNCTYNDFFS